MVPSYAHLKPAVGANPIPAYQEMNILCDSTAAISRGIYSLSSTINNFELPRIHCSNPTYRYCCQTYRRSASNNNNCAIVCVRGTLARSTHVFWSLRGLIFFFFLPTRPRSIPLWAYCYSFFLLLFFFIYFLPGAQLKFPHGDPVAYLPENFDKLERATCSLYLYIADALVLGYGSLPFLVWANS